MTLPPGGPAYQPGATLAMANWTADGLAKPTTPKLTESRVVIDQARNPMPAAIKVRPAANGQARLSEQISRLVRGELYLAQVAMPARIFWVPGVASRAAGSAPAASGRTCAEIPGCAAYCYGLRWADSRCAAAWRGCP